MWELAGTDYAKALDLNAPVDGASWWGIPQLLWHIGDKKQYSALCDKILASNHGSAMSMNAIRSCLFGERTQEQWESLAIRSQKLVDEDRQSPPLHHRDGGRPDHGRDGVREVRNEDRRPPPKPGDRADQSRRIGMPRGAALYVAGWAQYRANDFETAIDLLERSNTNDREWPGLGISNPLLAMAYHGVGRSADAQTALAAANKQFDQWAEDLASMPIGKTPIPWFDLIEFIDLRREATLLLTGILPSDDPLLTDFYQRSLDALDTFND